MCKFPAENFYAGKRMFTNPTTAKEMETKANRLKRLWPNRNPSTPFVFCDLIGMEEITDTEFVSTTRVGQESKFNIHEADKIVSCCAVLNAQIIYLWIFTDTICTGSNCKSFGCELWHTTI